MFTINTNTRKPPKNKNGKTPRRKKSQLTQEQQPQRDIQPLNQATVAALQSRIEGVEQELRDKYNAEQQRTSAREAYIYMETQRLNTDIQAQNEELEFKNQSLNILNTEIREQQTYIQTLLAQNSQLESKVQTLTIENIKLSDENKQLKANKLPQNLDTRSLIIENHHLKGDMYTLTSEKREREATIQTLSTQLKNQEQVVTLLSGNLYTANNTNSRLQEQNNELSQENLQLKRENAALQSQINLTQTVAEQPKTQPKRSPSPAFFSPFSPPQFFDGSDILPLSRSPSPTKYE